jgi:hypothetical protein
MFGFSFAPLRLCIGKLVALTIALSFIATLAPIALASLAKSNTMACCAGKAAGHCDSGIAPKQLPPPKAEPMCGLETAGLVDDGITIVAEPYSESHHSHSQTAETDSSQPAAESASLSQPCQMDCGACLVGLSRQQKRERSLVQTFAFRTPSLTSSDRFEYLSLLFSSNEGWKQTSPRGPPSAI